MEAIPDETEEEKSRTSLEKRQRGKEIHEHPINSQDDAGPSGSRPVPLPGAILDYPETNFQSRPGLSKSEHNLRQIITNKDLALALKSISFGNPKQTAVNVPELKIPTVGKDLAEEIEATFLDVKKFMASCLKFKDNTTNVNTDEAQIKNAKIAPQVIQEVPNTSCSNVQTENPPITNITNEVIVTNTASLESKLSKVVDSNKKKTSGSLSERSNFGLAQRDSLSSIGSNVCRICMTRGRERLISPCNCKGSMANVHLSCLERWLNQVGRNHCELCGYSYPAIRTPRYTVVQALRLWFGNPRNRSHLQSDCLIFWLLSTVTAGLLAVCVVGTQYFVIEGNKFGKLAGARKEEGISRRITETAMDFFMAVVLCGYSVTVYLLWKDHYVMWNRWRRANVNVRLLLSPDANPVPFVPRHEYNVV